ncbi:MAG: carbamoyltransferase HypF, partial [Anaerolineaceae bacterium]|nr:carbamoyltransferase HypF [Anaerolineaceae bacterium]
MTDQNSGLKLKVEGIVQGVGFRPFVFNLAKKLSLNGWVRNTSSGVEIELTGKSDDLDSFVHTLRNAPPPLAKIDNILVSTNPPSADHSFEILDSQPKPGDFLPVSPDVSICPDCLRELFDPADRRYRYPFINCTNCGPRFT